MEDRTAEDRRNSGGTGRESGVTGRNYVGAGRDRRMDGRNSVGTGRSGGKARPSRYGLSSSANFPPARSVRSPGGLQANDDPSLYEQPRDAFQPSDIPYPYDRPRPLDTSRLYDRSLSFGVPCGEIPIPIAEREPRFGDALRQGPWTDSALRRWGFLLALAECAVYAACFYFLLDPLTVLTARTGAVLSPLLAAAGVSLAGTLGCTLFFPLFRERRILTAAWGWLLAAALLLLVLLQALLWGEVRAQWAVLRFLAFFALGPVASNGAAAYALLYIHWRLAHPRKKREKEEEDSEEDEAGEEDDEEEDRDRRAGGRDKRSAKGKDKKSAKDRDRPGGKGRDKQSGKGRDERSAKGREKRGAQDRDERNRDTRDRKPEALDRTGWNRNLSASYRGGWEYPPSGTSRNGRGLSDRNRWRQTEADRDGRRQAESGRNKWK